MDSINNTTRSTTTSSNSNIPTQLPNSIQMDSMNNTTCNTTTTTTTEQQAQTSKYTYKTISSAPPKRRAGRTKFRETRHPVFKGVRQRGGGEGGSSRPERWVCEVREPNNKSRLWLGTFPTPEMAARAHDVAAMALRGRSACLNFADSAWRLPVPESSGREEIQRAAVVAAEMFRPKAGAEEVVTSASASASASATATATADSQEESKPGLVSGVSPTCSMLDLKMEEFGGDHHCWDTDIATGLLDSGGITGSSCYYWDDYAVDTSSNDCSVADYEVSLWSYSI